MRVNKLPLKLNQSLQKIRPYGRRISDSFDNMGQA